MEKTKAKIILKLFKSYSEKGIYPLANMTSDLITRGVIIVIIISFSVDVMFLRRLSLLSLLYFMANFNTVVH